jgi:hypothetical protein
MQLSCLLELTCACAAGLLALKRARRSMSLIIVYGSITRASAAYRTLSTVVRRRWANELFLTSFNKDEICILAIFVVGSIARSITDRQVHE